MGRVRGKPPEVLTHDACMSIRIPAHVRDEFLALCKRRDVWAAQVVRDLIGIYIRNAQGKP
jgi:hypothetical protein